MRRSRSANVASQTEELVYSDPVQRIKRIVEQVRLLMCPPIRSIGATLGWVGMARWACYMQQVVTLLSLQQAASSCASFMMSTRHGTTHHCSIDLPSLCKV